MREKSIRGFERGFIVGAQMAEASVTKIQPASVSLRIYIERNVTFEIHKHLITETNVYFRIQCCKNQAVVYKKVEKSDIVTWLMR